VGWTVKFGMGSGRVGRGRDGKWLESERSNRNVREGVGNWYIYFEIIIKKCR